MTTTNRSFEIPVKVPDGARASDGVFRSVVSDTTPLARRVEIEHDTNIVRISAPTGVSGWSGEYDASSRTMTMAPTGDDDNATTADALNAVGVFPGTDGDGTVTTRIVWDTIVSWTLEDVHNMAGGEWPAHYADRIAPMRSTEANVTRAVMSPDNRSFAFAYALDVDGESDYDFYFWIGEYSESDELSFKFVGIVRGPLVSVKMVPISATKLIGITTDNTTLSMILFSENAGEGTFTRETIHTASHAVITCTAGHSETDVAFIDSGSQLYTYDGSSTLIVTDLSGTVAYSRGMLCTGANSYIIYDTTDIHVVEDRAVVRSMPHWDSGRVPMGAFVDAASTTFYYVYYNSAYDLFSIDYSGVNSRVLVDQLGIEDGVNVIYVTCVNGIDASNGTRLAIYTTTDGSVRTMSTATLTADGEVLPGTPDEVIIRGWLGGANPVFHSNNGTGLIYASDRRIGVYGTAAVDSFDTVVLRAAKAVEEVEEEQEAAQETVSTATVVPTATDNVPTTGLGATTIALISTGAVLLVALIFYLWWWRRRAAASPA